MKEQKKERKKERWKEGKKEGKQNTLQKTRINPNSNFLQIVTYKFERTYDFKIVK